MSENNVANIIIAVITAVGSIVGGIIGAYATINAAKSKEEKNPAPTDPATKTNSWKGMFPGALIGAVLTLVVLAVLGVLNFKQNTSPNTPVSQPASGSLDLFVASSPLIINGTSYSIPTSGTPSCVSSQETGDVAVEYDLVVPKGWFIVWDSSKAYWTGGSYEYDGLLQVYGDWQGKVTVVNGGYCAVPIEWKTFAMYSRVNASPKAQRPQFSIGEAP